MAHPLQQDLDYILAQTGDLWEAIRGQAVFITGGTGFVGTWLVESFVWANRKLDLGARAVLLTRNPDAFRAKAPEAAEHSSLRFVRGEIDSFEFPDGSFPYVIHAATQSYFGPTAARPASIFDSEVEGTRRVLDFARTHGTRRFLFTSSGAVYGKQPAGMANIPEEYAGAPLTTDASSAYGQAKRVSEWLSVMYARQYGFVTLLPRLFAFAGPHLPLDLNFAIGNFLRDVIAGGPVRIQGDGTPERSYLYAADLAIWLWTILIRGESGRPYNVGSGVAVTIAQLARAVVDNTVPGTATEIAREAVAGMPIARYVPAVDRAARELGLRPVIGLEEAIRRMYAWSRESRARAIAP
ncbi:MAG: NAD(P)-dependent oxidoreductase [Acidobacteriaceae bacterium]|nr:NAD(P)-dependent oxidoreductase [Acidobacteriaceae bacterium]